MRPRRTTRRRAASAATAALLVLALAGVPVAAHGPDPILGGGLFDQGQDLAFGWSPDGVPPAALQAAILAAAGDANGSRLARSPSFGHAASGPGTVAYGTEVPCGVNGLACMRRSAPDGFAVWFREQGHRFDWGVLRWCEMYEDAPDGCYEAENVMLDELGHVAILDHHANYGNDSDYLDAVVQTYSRTKPKVGWNAHAFGPCDVATLQRQYDVLSWTTLYSTCAEIPTVATFASTQTTAPYGSMVTFTATLRTGSGFGRLSANPVAGRRVVIQRRLAGSTTWSDLAAMGGTATAGSYSYSYVVRSGADYRMVFRKPAAEGLGGAVSPYVTVKVTAACNRAPCPQSAVEGVRR